MRSTVCPCSRMWLRRAERRCTHGCSSPRTGARTSPISQIAACSDPGLAIAHAVWLEAEEIAAIAAGGHERGAQSTGQPQDAVGNSTDRHLSRDGRECRARLRQLQLQRFTEHAPGDEDLCGARSDRAAVRRHAARVRRVALGDSRRRTRARDARRRVGSLSDMQAATSRSSAWTISASCR